MKDMQKEKDLPQALMQIYILQRLLERISISECKDNFILKGGMLISSIIGIENRATMDIKYEQVIDSIVAIKEIYFK